MTVQQLGPYRIGKLLGRGGMGTVYLGEKINTHQRVAVKVLSPIFARDDSFRERFEAEIASLEKLKHPNIVQLFGYGQQDEHLFYAMELVEGTSLQEELSAERRFDWRETITLGVEVCKALKHAHDHGVIHRDIKPANLLLGPGEQIKLSDFGIAKLFGNTQLTADGGILGTADYMAPEQAEALPASPRCDLYSLGSVLYALLAGRPPFTGKSLPDVIHKVRFDQPEPVRRYSPDTPRALEEVLGQLLEKDPEDRIPTALSLSKRLLSIQHALSVHPTLANPGQDPTIDRSSDTDFLEDNSAVEAEKRQELAKRETAFMPSDAAVAPLPKSTASREETPNSTADSTQDSVSNYTTVDQWQRQETVEEPTDYDSWTKWLISTVTLAAVIAGLWYATRPRSANQIHARIQQVASEGVHQLSAQDNLDQIVDMQREIDQFLRRFPQDPRRDELMKLRKTIELELFQRNLMRRSRTPRTRLQMSPVELVLDEALQLENRNSSQAMVKHAAIIDVFGDVANDPLAHQCVEISRRALERLSQSDDAIHDHQLANLMTRLQHGIDLRGSAAASKIFAGIIDLYADKPWAEPAVSLARDALAGDEITLP